MRSIGAFEQRLSGNAFTSRAGGLRLNLEPVILDTFCQRLAIAATFFRKKLCCPGAMTPRWAPPNRYTLRRDVNGAAYARVPGKTLPSFAAQSGLRKPDS